MEKRILNNIHFLKVKGSQAQRFRASAHLMRGEIGSGAAPYLAERNGFLIRHQLKHPRIGKLIGFLYDKGLIPLLKRQFNAEQKEAIEAFVDGCDFSEEEYAQLVLHPDLFLQLARLAKIAAPGCTSCVVLKERTKGNKLLVARNLDYPAVGFWEKTPMVVFNEPESSEEIPYVFISSAGIHSGSLTSINRAGLTLSLHAHVGRKTSFFGTPIAFVGDEIIRKAKTVGEAIDLAKKRKVLANWAFVISSGKENEAVVVEMTPRKVCVRSAQDGFLAHTNFFHAKELENEETILGEVCQEDMRARLLRMTQMFEEVKEPLEPKHLIAMLGDHVDPTTGEERVFGNTVSVINTVSSAVLEPEGQKIWVSTRTESPTGLGPFMEVDLERFWEKEPSAPLIEGHPQSASLLEGIKWYREAYRESRDPRNLHQTQAYLEKAIAAFPQDGHLWVQAGLVAFCRGEWEAAKRYFEESRSRNVSPVVERVRDRISSKPASPLIDLQFPGPLQ